MKLLMTTLAVLLLLTAPVFAEDQIIELHYEPSASSEPSQELFAAIKLLRPISIGSFSDKRDVADTYIGDLKVNGQPKRLLSKTALALYVTDVFSKVFAEWGGKTSPDGQLLLKGEISQFRVEETDGYQVRVGFHFYLLDGSGKVLWDGHTSGIVRGSGRTLTPETVSVVTSDILRTTFAEMIGDEKLIGVWSGKVSNTYVIRGGVAATAVQAGGAK